MERFDAYVDRCLYDPSEGFYRADRGRAGGRQGDFLTSPEVGPLFGTVLARAVDRWWAEAASPEVLPVFDAGSGPGSLARMLSAAPGPSQAARLVRGFDRPDDGPGVPAEVLELLDRSPGSIVIANELLDNLAPRVIERTSTGWSEVYVTVPAAGSGENPSERLVAVEPVEAVGDVEPVSDVEPVGDVEVRAAAGSPDDAWLEELLETLVTVAPAIPIGARIPVQAQARQWVQTVVQTGARLVVFDYGWPYHR